MAVLFLLLSAAFLLALYFVVRQAVTHGIVDADDARTAQARTELLEEQLRNGTLRITRDPHE